MTEGPATGEDQSPFLTFGVLSILEGEPCRLIKDAWKRLEEEHGLVEAQAFEHPHISLQGGSTDCLDDILEDFDWLLDRLEPLDLVVGGVGHFGTRVVFLRVEPTEALLNANRIVNEYLRARCSYQFPRYTPESWVPHVTLAICDLPESRFEVVLKQADRFGIEFTQRIGNVCIATRGEDGRIEMVEKWQLRG